MSYGKHWETMYTGSMYGAGIYVFAVWGYVVANTGLDHHVELNPQKLADTLGGEVGQIEAAIDYLCAPDPNSRSKGEAGSRLVKFDSFRYFVVNHETYRTMRNNEERREYFRTKQQESRARKRLSNRLSTVSTETETETETEAKKKHSPPATAGEPSNVSIPAQGIADLYNSLLPNLPAVRLVNPRRRAAIRRVWQEDPERRNLEWWRSYFEECADSPFLNGTGPYRPPHENWRPTFDFLIRSDQIVKVYEAAMHKGQARA